MGGCYWRSPYRTPIARLCCPLRAALRSVPGPSYKRHQSCLCSCLSLLVPMQAEQVELKDAFKAKLEAWRSNKKVGSGKPQHSHSLLAP